MIERVKNLDDQQIFLLRLRVKLLEPQTGVVSQASQFMQQVIIKNCSDLPLIILHTTTSKGLCSIAAGNEAKLLFTKKKQKQAISFAGQPKLKDNVGKCLIIIENYLLI